MMIWLAGLDKTRNFLNKTWLEFTGQEQLQEKEKIAGRRDQPENLPTYESIYDSSFMVRELFKVEYRLRRNDGEYRWMLDIAKPSYSPLNVFVGYIGSSTELHDKKLLHDELEQMVVQRTTELENLNKELQRSNGELQQFAYVASHDLQEPLRKIMTFSDRLKAFKAPYPSKDKYTSARLMNLPGV